MSPPCSLRPTENRRAGKKKEVFPIPYIISATLSHFRFSTLSKRWRISIARFDVIMGEKIMRMVSEERRVMLWINTKVSNDINMSIFRVEKFQLHSEGTLYGIQLRNLLYWEMVYFLGPCMQTFWKQTSAHNTVHHIGHTIQSSNTDGGVVRLWPRGVRGLSCLIQSGPRKSSPGP